MGYVTTPIWDLRYPDGAIGAKPDVAGDIQRLALDTDAALTSAFSAAIDVSGTDLNSIARSGWYSGNNLTHSPDGTTAYFVVLSLYRGSALASQTATRNADGATFRRTLTGSGWTAWKLTASDTGWSLTPISLASGWSTLTDPNGNTGTSVVGGARIVAKTLELRFRVKRTGAALDAGSDGNLPDTNLGTVAAGFIPTSPIYDAFTNGNYSGVVRLGSDGVLQVTGQYPSDSIATNDIVQVQIRGFID